MDSTTLSKVRKARYIGASFFILLALLNVAFEIYYHYFSWFDMALLVVACLPILFRKRIVSFVLGAITFLATCYLGFAFALAYEKSVHSPTIIPVETWMFAIGYLLLFLSFCASLLLVYSAVSISEKRFSLT